jgi:peptidoglycan/xylan/chitin deacetylase (PgdA/CDA1 family)
MSGSVLCRVVLTHDVDWSPSGPCLKHILARKERFSENIISRVVQEGYNPYFNIPDLMEIEEKYGVKSTFFFRHKYDDGSFVDSYEKVIRDLVIGGWEVGVHINDASTVDSMRIEKEAVERIARRTTYGSRVHNLRIEFSKLSFIEEAELKYDSSVTFSKDAIDVRNTGYFNVGKLVEFPVTIMDAYLFTYMHIPEERIIDTVKKAVKLSTKKGFMTILWHDCSLKMTGGRMYSSILEFLASKENVELVRGVDAYNLVVEKARQS